MVLLSANSLATSEMRRMFSLRSFSEKPRSLFRPKRTLSPSRRYAASPRCRRCCSRAVATVDLPEADRPVNQMVKPFCLRKDSRSVRERDGCQVMLLRVGGGRSGRLVYADCTILGRAKGQVCCESFMWLDPFGAFVMAG